MVATSGAGWRLARCLVALVDETDRLYPDRSTASDGSVSSLQHRQQNPNSDHDPDASGDVLAVDLTDDDAHGCDVQRLMDHLIATRDDRVKYLIHQRVIVNCNDWTRRRYTGENPHTHHLHVSVRDTTAAKSDTSAWWPTPTGDDDDMTPDERRMLDEVHAAVIGEKSGLYAILTVARRVEALAKRIATKVGA